MNKKETITVKNEAGEEVKLDIRMPSGKQIQDSNIVYSSVWREAAEDKRDEEGNVISKGAMLSEHLEEWLEKNGLWDKSREEEKLKLIKKMATLQYELKTVRSKSTGKKIAFQIKDIQNQLRKLLEKRNSYESVTAESIAQDARFDYLLSQCVVNNLDGKPYFKSYEDYLAKKTDPTSWTIASKFATLYYGGYNEDYEKELIENKFLRKFGFQDEQGFLLDSQGRRVTESGQLINEQGEFINESNERVDLVGNPLIEATWDNLEE